MSVDTARGLVFLPTSSPSPDFFGGLRAGDNRYANSVVALHARDGTVAWHFQIVHHDVWDYDLPAQPSLVRLHREGRAVDALVQVTKQGFVFVFDRATGEPLFGIEERPVPQGAVAGEALSPTQPMPVAPPPIAPQSLSADKAWGLTPWGMLTAIDLADGTVRWESVLGTVRDLAPLPIPLKWGTPNFGGPIVTAGGVVFIGATMDDFLRAFDAASGEELWAGRLPAGGQATPMTYVWGGRQFVVIAAGGHSTAGTRTGDSVVAFALPIRRSATHEQR